MVNRPLICSFKGLITVASMRPVARKQPFCKRRSRSGWWAQAFWECRMLTFNFDLSFGGRALWTHCDIWTISQQLFRAKSLYVFESSLLWEEDQWAGTTAPAWGCRSGQLLCPSVLDVPAGAGQEGRWLSESISFWISGLERARPGIIWFSPPLQLALPHDPLFRSSRDTDYSMHSVEKWHKNL